MEKSAEPQLYLEKIENLNVSYPDWPFALVRLGKAYLLLEDLHGALEQFEKALNLLSPLQDEKFAQYVEGLRTYIRVIKSSFINAITESDPFQLGP
jgi:tetratricopeptide (TPR) repeat protein